MSWEIQSWAEDIGEVLDLSPAEAGVLQVLARRCDESASCFPKQDHIQMSSRFKRTAVISALKSLIDERGLVTKENRICPGEGRCGNADCRGGHRLGNRYYLQMEYGEQFIAEAIMSGRTLPSGRHKSKAKYLAAAKRYFDNQPDETPGQVLSPADGHREEQPVENLSPADGHRTKTPGQPLSPGNEHRGTKVRETNDQSPADGLPARDLMERARVSNFQSNFHSSSPTQGEYSPSRTSVEAEPSADAVGDEEEPLPGAMNPDDELQAAVGPDGHDAAAEVLVHPIHGTVSLAEIIAALSAVSTAGVDADLARKFAELVLSRGKDEPKHDPTRFVVSAIRNSAARTRRDLATITGESVPGSGALSSRPRPAQCPIPAHADLGHHQSNCPECRDLTGDGNFPDAITTEIYDQLSEAGKASINRYQVPVRSQVSFHELKRSRSWADQRPRVVAAARDGVEHYASTERKPRVTSQPAGG